MTLPWTLEGGAERRYTGAMTESPRFQPAELLKPLPLASYAAWLAVYATNTGWLGLQDADHGLAGQILLWLFLAAWLLALSIETRLQDRLGLLVTLALALSALGFLLLGPTGTGPILLVLLATQLAMQFHGRGLLIALVCVNVALLVIMRVAWEHPWNWVLLSVASYAAFQVFAALSMHYAIRAEEMADRLREVNAHLIATRSLLDEAARDQERLRLSRELHDVAGHKLTALKLNLRNLARQPGVQNSSELNMASSLASELLDDLRAVVRQLRDHDGIDLANGIRKLTEPLPNPEVTLRLDDSLRIPRAEQAETLLRVVQEGLTNAARHGRARHAWVDFGRDGENFRLQLEDDGRLTWPVKPGNGLTGMQERLELLGGSLHLGQSSHGGLRLTARLPAQTAT